ncbi:MAG: C69 family dipeptidase [Bacteroidales bacterium]|nr:C69 family dipeptidase [Bacteroidales bacterium]
MTNKKLFTLILLLIFTVKNLYSCTNFLITKGATTDGSTMISYSADSHVLYGELYHWPASDHPAGSTVDVFEWDTGKYLGTIPQAMHTYSVVGNMNEHQLAIGETTFGGRPELEDTTGIIDYGSLMYMTLQRARTAREAIRIMDELLSEHGYYSSGESLSISDPEEVWIMELIGKGPGNKGAVWVARRVPDGYICGHANQSRITTFPLNDPDHCMYSYDVISFAREMGYYKGPDEDFSFSDAYAPVDFEGARFCEARVWSGFRKVTVGMDRYLDYIKGENLNNRMPLWVKADRKLTVKDAMELMRDYFQGTELDMTEDFGSEPFRSIVRWRPLTWEIDGVEYFNERAVSTQQTGFSFIAQARSWLPDPIGGILWFGVDDTYTTVYTPMYCGVKSVPVSYAAGNGDMMEFSDDAAFWVFNQVSNFAYTRYNAMIPFVQDRQKKIEHQYLEETAKVDQEASSLYKENPDDALEYITAYSAEAGNRTVAEWKKLYAFLFTRFMDGNIKTKVEGQQNPEVVQPGYSETWYRIIVEQNGDKFRVPVTSSGH